MTKLELSKNERNCLAQYLADTTHIGQTARLDGLVDLLNKLREPVAIGTVRVSPEGYVAVKHRATPCEAWWVYRFGSGLNNSGESDDYVLDWTTVFTPNNKPGETV